MAKSQEELLKECIERLNAIDLNAKKIDELPHQLVLQTLSKLHVSNQGTSEYLEVQQIVDAVTALTYDRIVSIGTIFLSVNTITIPANAQWVITNVNYSNVLPIALNSPFAANGLARKDIIVANKFNSMTLIRGTETAGITIRPNIPIDTVLVTEMDVTDSNIGNILPPNTSTNGIVTTRIFYQSADITTSFEAYIDDLPPFTVAVNEIVYFESVDNNDVYLLLVRGGTYGQGQTGLGNRNYLKFTGGSSTQLRQEPFIYTTGAQEFELPEAAAQIVLVTVNGTPVYDYTVLSDTLVRVDLLLVPTVRVVIHYLIDLNLDIAPYYTQAQVDALIASAGGGGTSGEWTPTASALVNLISVTPANAYWSKIGNFVTLNFIANIVLSASGLLSFELTVPTAYPIVLEDPNIGNGVLQNNGFTPVLCQTKSSGTEVSIQSKATVSGSLNAMIHINLTYKTT